MTSPCMKAKTAWFLYAQIKLSTYLLSYRFQIHRHFLLFRLTLSHTLCVSVYVYAGVFSERCTEKLPLRVDFIHRVEFGELSGHRVLIKRGPGNRGPTECGTTHEATSGMSS